MASRMPALKQQVDLTTVADSDSSMSETSDESEIEFVSTRRVRRNRSPPSERLPSRRKTKRHRRQLTLEFVLLSVLYIHKT